MLLEEGFNKMFDLIYSAIVFFFTALGYVLGAIVVIAFACVLIWLYEAIAYPIQDAKERRESKEYEKYSKLSDEAEKLKEKIKKL